MSDTLLPCRVRLYAHLGKTNSVFDLLRQYRNKFYLQGQHLGHRYHAMNAISLRGMMEISYTVRNTHHTAASGVRAPGMLFGFVDE
jgi:hypothetical protein